MRLRGSKCIKAQETAGTCRLQASLTVEAALALPLMMFIIVSFAFLIHILRVHEIVHSSMYNAANQMAIQNFAIVRLAEVYDRNNNRRTSSTGMSGNLNDFYFGLEELNMIASRDSFLGTVHSGAVQQVDINSALTQIWRLYEFIYYHNIHLTHTDNILRTDEELFKAYLLHEFYKRANQSYDGSRIDRIDRVNEMLNQLRIADGFDGLEFLVDPAPPTPNSLRSHFQPYHPNDAFMNTKRIRIRYEVRLPFTVQNIEGIRLSHIVVVQRWGMGHN